MNTLPQKETLARWDSLPQVLRDALVDDANADFLWSTCESEHLSREKIKVVARYVGYVMFGFIHPSDLAKELRDALGIDIRITQVIADAVNERIFKPLQAEIDMVYAPPGAIRPVVLAGVGPKVIEEIEPLVPVGAPALKKPLEPGGAGVIVAKPTFPQSSESMWAKSATGFGSPSSMASKLPSSLNVSAKPVGPAVGVPRPPIVGNLQKTEMGKIPRPGGAESRIQNSEFSRNAGGNTGMSSSLSPTPAPAPMPVFWGGEAPVRPITNTPQFMPKSFDRMASAGPVSARPPVPPAIVEFGIPKPPTAQSSKPTTQPLKTLISPAPLTSSPLPKPTNSPVPLPPKKDF